MTSGKAQRRRRHVRRQPAHRDRQDPKRHSRSTARASGQRAEQRRRWHRGVPAVREPARRDLRHAELGGRRLRQIHQSAFVTFVSVLIDADYFHGTYKAKSCEGESTPNLRTKFFMQRWCRKNFSVQPNITGLFTSGTSPTHNFLSDLRSICNNTF